MTKIPIRIMVPLANGFEEIEAMAVVDILRWAGIQVDMVGVVGSVITGARGVRVMVDKRLNEMKADDYDGIVLPGGDPGYSNLSKSRLIVDAVHSLNDRGKLIAAICYSPMLLSKIGLLEGRTATIYPGKEREIPYPRGEKVVVDGNIITSQGPGTAIDFALAIVEYLLGPEKAANMRRVVVA
jgi:4-methyl-5(b-hydroxyethyl)-thiazole monophosphate biosynthesis